MRALRRRLMLAACALSVLLAGCGFQLQGRANLSPALARVHLQADDAQSDFTAALRRSLRLAGADIVAAPTPGVPTLRVELDDWSERIASVSARNVPREYELTYRVRFAVTQDGQERIASEEVSLTRDLSFDERRALAKEREREALRATLAGELAAVVVQRVSSLR